jgi:hypothetical protein
MNIIIENFKDYVLIAESGFARVAHIMRGFVPKIQSIGFITAENPNGKQATPEFNKSANEKLEKKLRLMNLGFNKIKGQYGNKENSFFVPNITKNEILDLGKEFDQETIIYGERISEEKDGKVYDGMNFQMIYSSGSVIAERKVFINDQDRPDLYSVVKGRKFFIPFFDDAYEDAEFTSKSGIVKNIGVKESVINEINSYVNHILEDNVTVKSRWINRGHILNLLKEIK